MPSHTSRWGIGTRPRSDSLPVTLLDWRSNRLADSAAKTASSAARLGGICADLEGMAVGLRFHAAMIGITTKASNHHTIDGKVCRDAFAPRLNWIRSDVGAARPRAAAEAAATAEAVRPSLIGVDVGTPTVVLAQVRFAMVRPRAVSAAATHLAAQRSASTERLQGWLSSLQLVPREGGDGPTPFASIRRRIADRESAALALSPPAPLPLPLVAVRLTAVPPAPPLAAGPPTTLPRCPKRIGSAAIA